MLGMLGACFFRFFFFFYMSWKRHQDLSCWWSEAGQILFYGCALSPTACILSMTATVVILVYNEGIHRNLLWCFLPYLFQLPTLWTHDITEQGLWVIGGGGTSKKSVRVHAFHLYHGVHSPLSWSLTGFIHPLTIGKVISLLKKLFFLDWESMLMPESEFSPGRELDKWYLKIPKTVCLGSHVIPKTFYLFHSCQGFYSCL